MYEFSRIELILEKKLFIKFLGAYILTPISGHGREKQPVFIFEKTPS